MLETCDDRERFATCGLLTTYVRVCTTDINELCESMSEVFAPNRVESYPRACVKPSRFNVADLGLTTLTYTDCGMTIRARVQQPESFYGVLIPVSGRAAVVNGRNDIRCNRHAAAIVDPDADIDTYCEDGLQAIMLRLDRSELEDHLARILGRPGGRPLRFHAGIDMTTPAARSWLSTLLMVCTDLDGPRGLGHPLLQRQTEQLLMSQLLTAAVHRYSSQMHDLPSCLAPVTPATIRRADQLISDHAREALTVHDIAEAIGISVRSLQHGFRRHLGITPTARLHQARLDGVHAELSAADPTSTTVTQLATQWGFSHLGRFAATYRTTFGETPSQTLRR